MVAKGNQGHTIKAGDWLKLLFYNFTHILHRRHFIDIRKKSFIVLEEFKLKK